MALVMTSCKDKDTDKATTGETVDSSGSSSTGGTAQVALPTAEQVVSQMSAAMGDQEHITMHAQVTLQGSGASESTLADVTLQLDVSEDSPKVSAEVQVGTTTYVLYYIDGVLYTGSDEEEAGVFVYGDPIHVTELLAMLEEFYAKDFGDESDGELSDGSDEALEEDTDFDFDDFDDDFEDDFNVTDLFGLDLSKLTVGRRDGNLTLTFRSNDYADEINQFHTNLKTLLAYSPADLLEAYVLPVLFPEESDMTTEETLELLLDRAKDMTVEDLLKLSDEKLGASATDQILSLVLSTLGMGTNGMSAEEIREAVLDETEDQNLLEVIGTLLLEAKVIESDTLEDFLDDPTPYLEQLSQKLNQSLAGTTLYNGGSLMFGSLTLGDLLDMVSVTSCQAKCVVSLASDYTVSDVTCTVDLGLGVSTGFFMTMAMSESLKLAATFSYEAFEITLPAALSAN
jgi:hypothetical protein